MTELWLDIPYYEGKYQVSDQGRVRSLDRTITRKYKNGKVSKVNRKGHILRPAKFTKFGHMSIPLGSKSHGRTVHELVMLAFEGERPDGMDILHIDGDASNNNYSNLTYGSRSENNRDIGKHGRRKLTYEQVAEARELRKSGSTLAELSEIYDTCRSNIGYICKGEYYAEA